MELDLQSLFGLLCVRFTHWLRPRSSPPRIWAQIRGRYWSANIGDISLYNPPPEQTETNKCSFRTCILDSKMEKYNHFNHKTFIRFRSNCYLFYDPRLLPW
jgi:hypothetical protein